MRLQQPVLRVDGVTVSAARRRMLGCRSCLAKHLSKVGLVELVSGDKRIRGTEANVVDGLGLCRALWQGRSLAKCRA